MLEATRGIVKLVAAGTIESDDANLLFDSLGGMTLARNSRLFQPNPLLRLPIFALVVVLGVSTIIIAAIYPTGPDRRLKWIQALLPLKKASLNVCPSFSVLTMPPSALPPPIHPTITCSPPGQHTVSMRFPFTLS